MTGRFIRSKMEVSCFNSELASGCIVKSSRIETIWTKVENPMNYRGTETERDFVPLFNDVVLFAIRRVLV